MLNDVDDYESLFSNPKEFTIAKKFILSFFEIMESNDDFQNQVISKVRTK